MEGYSIWGNTPSSSSSSFSTLPGAGGGNFQLGNANAVAVGIQQQQPPQRQGTYMVQNQYGAAAAPQHVSRPMCINSRPSIHPAQQSPQNEKCTLDALFVAFTNIEYTPSRGGYSDWLNKLSQRTGNLIHCELVFRMIGNRTGDTTHVCCTVYYGKNVGFEKDKNYNSRQGKWQRYQIRCSLEQLQTIYSFCSQQRNKPFNSWGYYLNFLPGPFSWLSWNNNGSSWLCSELALSALQQGLPELRKHPAHKTSPTALCNLLASYGFMLMGTITQHDTELLLEGLAVV